jgi:hypothetical protein
LKKFIAGAAIAVSIVGMGGTAFAGEVTGSGKGGPNGDGTPGAVVGAFTPDAHAHSICAFSGLNDNPTDPIEGGRVQNWGSIPKEIRDQLAAEGESPGAACRGNLGIMTGG